MRCEVLYVDRSMYEGIDGLDCPWPSLVRRETHRTFLAADYARRFRPAYMGPGWSSTTTTLIVKPGTEWTKATADEIPLIMNPRYVGPLERWVWRPLYWIRNRWDGLRFGLDRDSKS